MCSMKVTTIQLATLWLTIAIVILLQNPSANALSGFASPSLSPRLHRVSTQQSLHSNLRFSDDHVRILHSRSSVLHHHGQRTTLFATVPSSSSAAAASLQLPIVSMSTVSNATLPTLESTRVTIQQSQLVNVDAPPTTAVSSSSTGQKPLPFPLVVWKFTRPHTLIGSAVAVPALHALAAPSYAAMFTRQTLISLVVAMIPALLMNLYITGLNQITDVDIDKINKPYLPIVAGQLSMRTAKITVLVAVIGSLLLGGLLPFPFATQGLNVALWGSGILGTMYSLPPFRLKRFPLLAAFCIVAVRGTVINAGFFAHARAAAFGATAASSSVLHCLSHNPRCLLSSLYFGVFGIVIALMKDVPDVKGDRSSNVRTFPVRLGQRRVFHVVRRLLSVLLWGVGTAFFQGAWQASSIPLAAGRSAVAAISVWAGMDVRQRGRQVDPKNSQQVYSFYMHLWKIFYASYLLLPFAR